MIKQKLITLDNGLIVVCASDDSMHYIRADIIVKFGSANNDIIVENKNYHFPNGLQHLLEHLLLEHGPYGDLFTYFNDNYVSSNGSTGNCFTSYYFNCHENFDEYFIKLFKTINNSNFKEEDIADVKPPIYEEIRRANDNAGRKFFLTSCDSLFNAKQFSDGVGTIEDVKNFTYEDLQLIYNAFYKPSNEIIYIHGNFDIDSTLDLIKKLCNEIDRKFLDSKIIPFSESSEVNNKLVEYLDDKNYEVVSVNYKIDLRDYSKLEKKRLVKYLDMFVSSLCLDTGKIFRDLFDEEVTRYSPDTDFTLSADRDFFMVSVAVVGKDKDKIVGIINDAISNYCYPEKSIFELMKKRLIINSAIKFSDVSGILSNTVTNIQNFDLYEFDNIDFVKNLSLAEMKKYVGKIDFSNYSVVVRKNEM